MSAPTLNAVPVRTAIFRAGMDLHTFLAEHLRGRVRERSVVAITSKILSVAENRLVPKSETTKEALIARVADRVICQTKFGVVLTIHDGLLIPSAGIDESNSEAGHYLLYPKDAFLSARAIHVHLKQALGLREFGVIITDSHTHPLRRGVTGIALSHWGFRGVRNLVGESDLFGRKIQMTSVNTVDALAVAAVWVMGEAGESQPLAVVEASGLEFSDETDPREIQIPLEEDLYGPLLKAPS